MKRILVFGICLVFVLAGCNSKKEQKAKEISVKKQPAVEESVVDLKIKYKELIKAEKTDEAIAVINQVIELKGENRGILGTKYDLLMKLERFEEALVVALRRDEVAKRKSPWNCISIAEACLKLNQKEKALKYLSIAVNERNFNNLNYLKEEIFLPLKDRKKFSELIEQMKELIGIGRKAPDFTVQLINGEAFTLSAQKGKVVLIDFWATWCPPCRKELPHIKKLYGTSREKGFTIIGISLDTDSEKHRAYIQEKGLDWHQAYSGKGWYDRIVKQYHVSNIPSVWLIDRKGNLRYFDIHGEELDKAVQRLLAEK